MWKRSPSRPRLDLNAIIQKHVAGDIAGAEDGYREIISQGPEHPVACANLAVICISTSRKDEGIALLRRAIAAKPDYVDAHYNLGATLLRTGQLAEATESLQQAISLNPDHLDARNNLGVALTRQGRAAAAVQVFRDALSRRPNAPELHDNLAIVLLDQGQVQEAAAACEAAIALRPDFANAHYHLGLARLELRSPAEAITALERAQQLAPDAPYLQGQLFSARRSVCDWRGHDVTAAQISKGVTAGWQTDQPFSFLAVSDSPKAQLACARTFIADRYPQQAAPMWRGETYRHDRIRVAYLSADLYEHATAHLMAGLFEAHDRQRFETIAVSFGRNDHGAMRSRLESAFDKFIDVQDQYPDAIARVLRDLEVDIAVDLKGLTYECRPLIFAHRPAPVQVNFLGYPGTMGAPYMDYLIADRRLIPDADRDAYDEKIVYLPDSYQPNDRKRRIADETPDRAALGLPADGFVFCCFNNNYKLTPAMFDIWMRLLEKVPGSVLWLLEGHPLSAANLREEAQRRGTDPDRLVFGGRMAPAEHIARHRCADLFLDTLPYNAHTTASDALWTGLPVVTCTGKSFASRVGASLLDAAGMDELITDNLGDYEALALELAANPERLSAVRARLAQQRMSCALFDTERFRRHVEAAYTEMWQRQQRGEAPADIRIQPIAAG
jgi:predicted O-linked N-acetylglucosamine transferase (SPINDLY family)